MVDETNLLEMREQSLESARTRTKMKREASVSPQPWEEGVKFGVRSLVTNPVSACDRLDMMFGSGGEAIVHYMWFESGFSLFDSMTQCNRDRSCEELLRALVNAQPKMGWGKVVLNVAQIDPPSVNIIVKDPPVKTMKGSQKQMISSFWTGVLSRYFDKQLTCKSLVYDAQKDELSCTITI